MTRLAQGRTTHLEPAEIAAETLRFFDEGNDPSIRQLAAALQVTPSAIYHHFGSRSEIVQAAVDIVWQEILVDLLTRVGDPFETDPVEVLVASGLSIRKAFVDHCTIAPYMAATPQPDDLTAGGLAMMASIFERFGLKGEEAAEAFHTYASFTFGTALFAANRKVANQALERAPENITANGTNGVNGIEGNIGHFVSTTSKNAADLSSEETRTAMEGVMNVSSTDPERDEELFEIGLRRMIASFK